MFANDASSCEPQSRVNPEFFEKEPKSLKAGITIKELRKEFSSDSGNTDF